ncbi:MAG TPA: protein kinase [Myxococcaceae bacterium]|nr:protein kinase [Myxococcaceae bacterium]
MSVQSPRRNPIPFGTYLLLDRINIGGMAEVWRGKSFGAEGFERLVAIKRILPNIAEEADFKSMFIDEAKLSVLLSHANVAQVYELGELHGSLYIAMEYVAGKDLRFVFERSRKQQDPLPIPLVCHVIQRAAEGLDHAHRKKDQAGRELNIVHRDVSPQNILLSYDGEVKVIDFGIAKAAGWGTNTQTGVLKGKFGYMSPEQVLGQKIDRRSDVFALGVCLYELLTGERLFQGESDFSVLEKVANVDVQLARPSLQGLPAELSRIVTRALARSPEERYPFASDLADDLERYLHTSGRYFGRKDLMGFMHDAFGEDIDKELARQKDYAAVSATPEILEEIARGVSAKPSRPIRTRTGELPISLPSERDVPEGQQTAIGSSRGQRVQAMRAHPEAEVPAEEVGTLEASHPEDTQGASPAPEVTHTRSQSLPQATQVGRAPEAAASALHLETHVGPRPEPKVDVALVSASTHVGPSPTRPSSRVADGETRIGPAPRAPSAPAAPREAPRRSPTVGMPIPGILSMETHVGAAPLPPAPDLSEDSTTGSSGDPRRVGKRAERAVDVRGEHAPEERDAGGDPEGAATLATPSRLVPDLADATLAGPSRLSPDDAEELHAPLEGETPDATLPLPSDLSPSAARPTSLAHPSPIPEDASETLATPSRLLPPERSPDGPEGAGRRRPRRSVAERGSSQPVATTPLPSAAAGEGAGESEEATDAQGQRRNWAAAAVSGNGPEEVTDAEGRRNRAPRKVRSDGRQEAATPGEDTDAGRYADLPEEDTDAGPRHRAAETAVRARGARQEPEHLHTHRALHDADDEHGEDEAHASFGDDDEAQRIDAEDPETFTRPQRVGRARPLPIGATRFDGLFDARARRFTRRDLWLAGLAGAGLSLVLTLLVSLISGPRSTGLILVEVVGVPPSKTTVRLQGKELPPVMQFPVRAPAPLGEVEIELSAEGYRPARHLVRLTQPGEVAELRTSLDPL